MSVISNIARGAITTDSGILIGGQAEYCLRRDCGASLSSDGCSNPQCLDARKSTDITLALGVAVRSGGFNTIAFLDGLTSPIKGYINHELH